MTADVRPSDPSSRREKILAVGRRTLDVEAEAVASLMDRLDENFVEAVETILASDGRLVVTGMGKSGDVGRKLAATFASTGTSSFFMHAAEGVHGDLGMVREEDVVLAISYSGYTDEIQSILVPLERIGPEIVALTGEPHSVLADAADVVLDTSVEREAGPLDLAPTASTTATLALGDALAMALMDTRDFAPRDFARFHPQGSLGKRLLLRVKDIMHRDDDIPLVDHDVSMRDVLLEMTEKRLGITGVVDEAERLIGCVTDGDLRRILDARDEGFFDSTLTEVMTEDPLTIDGDRRAVEALETMEEHQITVLFIVDGEHRPTGAVHMHDILREGITEQPPDREPDEIPDPRGDG